jgi:hypothetical protein
MEADYPVKVTVNLRAGTYYLMDPSPLFEGGTPPLTKMTVTGRAGRAKYGHGPTVLMTSANRFVTPDVLPADGRIQVRNVSDTIHLMVMIPVRPGTTDAEVQAWFDSDPQTRPPWRIDGPGAGVELLSPGVHVRFDYRLPAGTYLLMCFAPDEVSGIGHHMSGMHEVVMLT